MTGAHPEVVVQTFACPDLNKAAMMRVLGIELGELLVESPTDSAMATNVNVSCDGDRATLRVDDPVTGKSLTREVELASTPAAVRPRLVALAIEELVDASWTELVANPEPKVPITTRVPIEIRSSAADVARRAMLSPPNERRVRLLATFDVENFFEAPAPLVGGGLLATRDFFGWLTIGLEVRAVAGHVDVTLGRVGIDIFSAAPILALTWHRDIFALRAAFGARVGSVTLTGTPSSSAAAVGEVVAAPFWAPFARASFGITLAKRVTFDLGIETGAVALPVRGRTADGNDVPIAGGWISGQFAIGVVF